MLSEYQKGIKSSCVFYGFMLLTMVVTHVVSGWENSVLWPRSVLVFVLSILVSLPWVCVNIINLFSPFNHARNLGEAIVHGIALTIAAVFVFIRFSVY